MEMSLADNNTFACNKQAKDRCETETVVNIPNYIRITKFTKIVKDCFLYTTTGIIVMKLKGRVVNIPINFPNYIRITK